MKRTNVVVIAKFKIYLWNDLDAFCSCSSILISLDDSFNQDLGFRPNPNTGFWWPEIIKYRIFFYRPWRSSNPQVKPFSPETESFRTFRVKWFETLSSQCFVLGLSKNLIPALMLSKIYCFAVRRVQQPGGELSARCRVQARPEHRSLHGEQVGTSVADPDPSDPYDLGLLDPDPIVRGPDPSIIKQI